MSKVNTYHWQNELAEVITDPAALLAMLDLDVSYLPDAEIAAQHFPLRVPHSFVARMQKRNVHDPLLQQILPIGAELMDAPDFVIDPLSEADKNPMPGLLHKYHGRVLFIFTGACAVNCRYCFRRHFPYAANNPGLNGWQQVVDYIKNDESISEVILSGGDPLVAPDKYLLKCLQSIDVISHVKRVRIHSRLPIVLPSRITDELTTMLASLRVKPVMVVHCNHAQEINHEVIAAVQLLRNNGIVVLNQAVLLKGVNDDVDTLVALSEALFACDILPYYLFTLDKVKGATHFDLPLTIAKKLHWDLAQRLPGYLVPRLAVEKPNKGSKIVLGYADTE